MITNTPILHQNNVTGTPLTTITTIPEDDCEQKPSDVHTIPHNSEEQPVGGSNRCDERLGEEEGGQREADVEEAGAEAAKFAACDRRCC